MIQRIQTIFLIFIILCMIGLQFFPFWMEYDATTLQKKILTAQYLITKTNEGIEKQSYWYLSALALMVAGVAVYSIFSYKQRVRQMGMGSLMALLMVGLVSSVVWISTDIDKVFVPAQKGDYWFGFYLIIAALVFNLLSNRFIRRDEKIVRDSNRMR